MWESQAAFLPDFSKRWREATRFVAFRERVISTAGVALCSLEFRPSRRRSVPAELATSFCCSFSILRLSCAGLSK